LSPWLGSTWFVACDARGFAKGPCVTQRAAPLSITHLSHKERQAGMYVLALIFQKFQRRWTAPVSFMPRVFRATWAPGCASLGGLRGRAGYRCRWNPAWLGRSSRFACNCFLHFFSIFFFSGGVAAFSWGSGRRLSPFLIRRLWTGSCYPCEVRIFEKYRGVEPDNENLMGHVIQVPLGHDQGPLLNHIALALYATAVVFVALR
jgi:hypothetical protein